jgi:anhydro-N-acetylmuramic acid kinase
VANLLTAIGLMSGTSMDGIDVALIRSDGEKIVEHGCAATFEFDDRARQVIAAAMRQSLQIKQRDERTDSMARAENLVTKLHIAAVESFLQQNSLTDSDIDIIGFHGQTVLHRPEQRLTVQLGCGQTLARQLSIPVVHDLRADDVAAGGQGAPLVPVYHRALAQGFADKPLAFVNIGGISNITYIDDDDLIAFDCGPGNALLNDWVEQHTGKAYDDDGGLAATGKVSKAVLQEYLANRYFENLVPKSLDRGDFTLTPAQGLKTADGARTLTEVTARAIKRALEHLPNLPARLIICGGGQHNSFLMQCIRDNVGGRVDRADDVSLNGDALEAEAFAYLAIRSLKNLPITYPETTGVGWPLTGGKLNLP